MGNPPGAAIVDSDTEVLQERLAMVAGEIAV